MKQLFPLYIFVGLNLVLINQLQAKEYVSLGIVAPGQSTPGMTWDGTTNISYCENENVDVTFYLNNYTGYCSTMDWKIYKNNLVVDSGITNYTTYFTNSPGAYMVVYTLPGNSCPSGVFLINISQGIPIPTITLVDGALFTNPGYSYQWYVDGNEIVGATSESYTPTASGLFQVKTTNSRGCENISFSFSFTLIPIDSIDIQDGLVIGPVFPNPNNGIFNLHYSLSENHTAELILLDIAGKRISTYQLLPNTQSTLTIAEENLNPGYYFCRTLLNGKVITTYQFVIAK